MRIDWSHIFLNTTLLDLLKIRMTTLMMHYTIYQKLITWIYLYVPDSWLYRICTTHFRGWQVHVETLIDCGVQCSPPSVAHQQILCHPHTLFPPPPSNVRQLITHSIILIIL